MDDNDPFGRLRGALGMDVEPTLPGVVPREPEQHRLPGMEREPSQEADRFPELVKSQELQTWQHDGQSGPLHSQDLRDRSAMAIAQASPEGSIESPAARLLADPDLIAVGRVYEQQNPADTYGQEPEKAAEPRPASGNAQFLREEDRTRPMPRPTLSMPGMDYYVGPVYPLTGPTFDPQAWGEQRAAPQAVPDIPEGSPLDHLMTALTQPEALQPDPADRRQEQALPAIEDDFAGDELRQGDPGTLSVQAAEAARAQEPGQGLTPAQDRLTELMERLDPGHAERQAAMSPDERVQQIEDQLQAFQRGREAQNEGRSF